MIKFESKKITELTPGDLIRSKDGAGKIEIIRNDGAGLLFVFDYQRKNFSVLNLAPALANDINTRVFLWG